MQASLIYVNRCVPVSTTALRDTPASKFHGKCRARTRLHLARLALLDLDNNAVGAGGAAAVAGALGHFTALTLLALHDNAVGAGGAAALAGPLGHLTAQQELAAAPPASLGPAPAPCSTHAEVLRALQRAGDLAGLHCEATEATLLGQGSFGAVRFLRACTALPLQTYSALVPDPKFCQRPQH